MSAHPAHLALAAVSDDPADLAHDARNALAGALGRIQLLARQAERGPVAPDRLRTMLLEAEDRLRRAVALVDALEDAADGFAPAAMATRSAA
jgi:nitrogen-specific signal transduction histidine kinase